MTALALRLPALPRLSWPRIGALSGAFSLHIGVILVLLMPPVAMQMIRQVREQPVVVTILDPPKPEVVRPEPPDPTPPRKDTHPRPTPVPVMQPAHTETPITTTDNSMGYTAKPDSGPADIAPARDVAPTALAYGTRTRVPYPIDSVRRREHGTVILRVLVGADGNPQTVEIETSSGSPRLDKAARDAVLQWRFQAGTRNGVAQAAWAKVPIAFDLTTL